MPNFHAEKELAEIQKLTDDIQKSARNYIPHISEESNGVTPSGSATVGMRVPGHIGAATDDFNLKAHVQKLDLQMEVLFKQVRAFSYALKNSNMLRVSNEVASTRFHPSLVSLSGGVLIENGQLNSTDEVDEFTFKFQNDQLIFNEIDRRHNQLLVQERVERGDPPSQVGGSDSKPQKTSMGFSERVESGQLGMLEYMLAKGAIRDDEAMDGLL